jgi:hypothetical protein
MLLLEVVLLSVAIDQILVKFRTFCWLLMVMVSIIFLASLSFNTGLSDIWTCIF